MPAAVSQIFGIIQRAHANHRKRKLFLVEKTQQGPFDPEKIEADHRDNKSIGEIGVYR